jgi:hypothetical protein
MEALVEEAFPSFVSTGNAEAEATAQKPKKSEKTAVNLEKCMPGR